MAGGPIRISILADTKDLKANLGSAEAAMDKAGDTAKAAGKRIDTAFDSTAESADTVASKGAQAAGALSGLGDLIGGPFGGAMMAGGIAMQAFADAGDLVNVITESSIVRKTKDIAVTAAKKTGEIAAAAASKAMAAAQWAINAAMEANPIGLVVVALAALVAGLVIAYKKSETFRDIVNGAFGAVKKVVENVIPPIKTIITDVFDAVKIYFKTVFKVYETVFKTAFTVIKTVTKTAFQAVKGFITDPIGTAKKVLDGILNKIKSAVTTVWNAIKGATKSAFNGVKDAVVGPFQSVVDFIKGIPGKISSLAGKFKSAGTHIINALIDGLKNAGGFVSDIAGKVWTAVKGMLNAAIDKINSALDFTIPIPAAPDVHVNVPDIPHLASGGITSGPTLAMVGDNPGGREAVIPLDKYDLSGDKLVGLLGQILGAIQSQRDDQAFMHRKQIQALRQASADAGFGAMEAVTKSMVAGYKKRHV